MGVNLGGILEFEIKKLDFFSGKIIAIDAYNTLYQFLSIIRQPDGTPLQDSEGNITSHLAGLFYRNANFLDAGIKPVYVFDGKPHRLKLGTIEARVMVRERAKEEWLSAVKEGDLEKARSKAQQTAQLTTKMVEDSKKLLEYLGVPYLVAPSEGEAQASYMSRKGDVWAVGSQDFDSLLFGAVNLVRNLTITGKRKLPKQKVYVDVMPEVVELKKNLENLGITQEQLVDIGILVGTDFNKGLPGIGPKKALKLIKDRGSLENVMVEKKYQIAGYEEIRNIFLSPAITDDYKLIWKEINSEKIIEFLCGKYEFSESRVSAALQKIEESRKRSEQKKLDEWF